LTVFVDTFQAWRMKNSLQRSLGFKILLGTGEMPQRRTSALFFSDSSGLQQDLEFQFQAGQLVTNQSPNDVGINF
jgi:hypothetical protein